MRHTAAHLEGNHSYTSTPRHQPTLSHKAEVQTHIHAGITVADAAAHAAIRSHQLPADRLPHASRQQHAARPQAWLHAARVAARRVHAADAEPHKLLDVLLQLAPLDGLEGAASRALAEGRQLLLKHLAPQLPAGKEEQQRQQQAAGA